MTRKSALKLLAMITGGFVGLKAQSRDTSQSPLLSDTYGITLGLADEHHHADQKCPNDTLFCSFMDGGIHGFTVTYNGKSKTFTARELWDAL